MHYCTVPPKFAPRKSEPQIDYNVITDNHYHKPYELSPLLTLFSIIVTQKVRQSKQVLYDLENILTSMILLNQGHSDYNIFEQNHD